MEFNTKTWIKKEKVANTFKSDAFKTKFNLIKSSVLAILFGLLIGIIIIFLSGYNGFAFIGMSIVKGLDPAFIERTINYFSTYALMGLGLAIGFKIGIFNMGGTGQATIGFTFSIIAIGNKASKEGVDFKDVPPSFVMAVFMIFILSGVAFSMLSGLLKVFFNIHEVVTTVMLNFILWYTTLWFFNTHNGPWGPNSSITVPVNSSWLEIGGNPWLLGLILVALSVGFLYVLITFTTFGYKFKVVGKQPSAADYAGINKNMFIITATALQGFFIGMGGFIYYMTLMKSLNVGTEVLPTIGFDAIPIALVAFNNFLGIIPVAFIWAVLNNGTLIATGTHFNGLSREIPVLIFGAITYGAGIYIIFTKFSPIIWVKQKWFIYKDIIIKNEIKIKNIKIKEQRNNLKDISKDKDIINLKEKIKALQIKLDELKSQLKELGQKDEKIEIKINDLKQEILVLNNQLKEEVENKQAIIKANIAMINDSYNIKFEKRYDEYKKYSIYGIKREQKEFNQMNRYSLLDEFVADSLYLDELKRKQDNEIQTIKQLRLEKYRADLEKIKEQNKLAIEKEKLVAIEDKQKALELKQIRTQKYRADLEKIKEQNKLAIEKEKPVILDLKEKHKNEFNLEKEKINKINEQKLENIKNLNKQEQEKIKNNIIEIKKQILINKEQYRLEISKLKEKHKNESKNIANLINEIKVKYTLANMEVIKNYE